MVRLRIAAMLGWLLAIGAGSVMATENASPGIDGKVLLVQNCARCHARRRDWQQSTQGGEGGALKVSKR